MRKAECSIHTNTEHKHKHNETQAPNNARRHTYISIIIINWYNYKYFFLHYAAHVPYLLVNKTIKVIITSKQYIILLFNFSLTMIQKYIFFSNFFLLYLWTKNIKLYVSRQMNLNISNDLNFARSELECFAKMSWIETNDEEKWNVFLFVQRNRVNLAEQKTAAAFCSLWIRFFANHEYGVFLCVPLDVRTILNTQFSSWHTQKSALELHGAKPPTESFGSECRNGKQQWRMGEQAHRHTHTHPQARTHTKTTTRASASTNDIEIQCGPWTKKKTTTTKYLHQEFQWNRVSERDREGVSALNQLTHSVTVAYQRNGWMDGSHRETWMIEENCEWCVSACVTKSTVWNMFLLMLLLLLIFNLLHPTFPLPVYLAVEREHTHTHRLFSYARLNSPSFWLVCALFINCKASLHHFPDSSTVGSCTTGWCFIGIYLDFDKTQIFTFFPDDYLCTGSSSAKAF